MNNCGKILAPAGSAECVKAAVRCGADAVYLGTKDFNARRNAENFGFFELKEIIEYCHARGVKVHITFNTLIDDEEINKAIETIKHICALSADVLILQDLGFAQLVRKIAPEIERHASTQMSTGTSEGIKLLEKLGYSLAVLPREMTKDEIEKIKKNTNIRLEAFVHGALCMCVSGQCYMSAMLGSRSGNRGLCAQPCRLAFSVNGGTGHDLSLKDLSLVSKARELSQIGVEFLKIEGRMKRPEYVAAAVTALKKAQRGENEKEALDILSAVFSRSGFTDGYYENKRGRNMFGIRTKEDVTAATNKVMSSLQRLYDKEQPLAKVDFKLTAQRGKKLSLNAYSGGKSVIVSDEYIPEEAHSKPSTRDNLFEKLSKCGGTFFEVGKVEINLDEGIVVPASVINSLRRNALLELEKRLGKSEEKKFIEPKIDIPKHKAAAQPKFHIRIVSPRQIPNNLDRIENIYVPLFDAEKFAALLKEEKITAAVEIPRGIFGSEAEVLKGLEKARLLGIKDAYCGSLDAVALAKKAGMKIHTGFSLNVFNSLSLIELEKLGAKSVTLSAELPIEKAVKIGGEAKRGIIAYGRLPLMLTRNCPMKNAGSCADCGKKGCLTDRMGIKFPIVCNNGFSEILNSRPIYLADRMDDMKNMDFVTLYFTKEKGESVNAIIDAYRKGKSASGEYTRGLYYRGVK